VCLMKHISANTNLLSFVLLRMYILLIYYLAYTNLDVSTVVCLKSSVYYTQDLYTHTFFSFVAKVVTSWLSEIINCSMCCCCCYCVFTSDWFLPVNITGLISASLNILPVA
jgi:hypothetical protein